MSLWKPLLAVSVFGYETRPHEFQKDLLRGLDEVLGRSAERAELRRGEWQVERAGGAQLAVLPGDEPERAVVFDFVSQLNAELIQYNRVKSVNAQLRLRVALHHGAVSSGATGFAGAGPVVARELGGSDMLGAALESSGTHLAVLLSSVLYDDLVAAHLLALDPSRLRRVQVGAGHAWLWVPGADPHGLELPEPSAAPDSPEPPDHPEPPPALDRPEPPSAAKQEQTSGDQYFTGATIIGPAAAGDITIISTGDAP